MKTLVSRFEFESFNADSEIDSEGCNTIEFHNGGDQIVVIDDYQINPGSTKKLGGRIETHITQVFDLVFTGSGTKYCQVTKEFVEAKN
jgi:hypothetical protein